MDELGKRRAAEVEAMIRGGARAAVDPAHQALRQAEVLVEQYGRAHEELAARVAAAVKVLAPDVAQQAKNAAVFATALQVLVAKAGGRVVITRADVEALGAVHLDVKGDSDRLVVEVLSAENAAKKDEAGRLVGPDGRPVRA